jgi:hypothetical protein
MLGGWQIVRFETDLPDLVLLVDTSRSMSLPASNTGASAARAETLGPGAQQQASQWDAVIDFLAGDQGRLWNRLAKSYRLQVYRVGDELQTLTTDFRELADVLPRLQPDGEASRLGDQWLRAVENQRGRSTAAVVMLSDGAITTGTSWEQAAEIVRAERLPLVVVQTGVTDRPPQLAVVETIADSTAMVGDMVSVLARVRWEGIRRDAGAPPLEIVMRDTRSGDVVFRRQFSPGSNGQQTVSGSELVAMSFTVTEPGKREYQVELSPYPGEMILDDNRSPVTIEVRDAAFRVLLVQGGPSYEFRFLKHLLERARTQDGSRPLVELISVLQQGDTLYAEQDRTARRLPPVDRDTLGQLDLIILSDCDPTGLGTVFMNQIRELVTEQGIALVVIAGPYHLPMRLAGTPLETLLPMTLAEMRAPELANRPWTVRLTELGEATPSLRIGADAKAWESAAEFYWRINGGNLRPGAQVLMETVGTGSEPVIVSQLVGSGRVWLQLTDEMFHLHSADSSGTIHERYWLQMIRGLARPAGLDDDEDARLVVSGERFTVGQAIPFQVQLSGPMATNAGGLVEVEAIDSQGATRRYQATSLAGGSEYRGILEGLGQGDLQPGAYRLVLTRPVGTGLPATDSFLVVEDSAEMVNFAVDLTMLKNLTEQSGGALVGIQEARGELERVLPQGRALRTRPLTPITLWNHWLVATLLFGLLSTEWLLRRRWGSV